MLTPIEIIPHDRTQLRRAVPIGCELFTERGGSRVESILDLSPAGARVTSAAMALRGEEVLLSFVPPGARDDRLSTVCRVAHAASRGTLGLEFVSLDARANEVLILRLRGFPPPLPTHRAMRRGMVWIDTLLSWEEDLGDRVNVFEVSARVALAALEPEFVSLAPPLGGGRLAQRWRIAS